MAHVAEVVVAEAARGVAAGAPKRMPEVTDRLFRIEGNAVLVAGDAARFERCVPRACRSGPWAQIEQQQVVVGAAGHQVDAAASASASASALALSSTWWV